MNKLMKGKGDIVSAIIGVLALLAVIIIAIIIGNEENTTTTNDEVVDTVVKYGMMKQEEIKKFFNFYGITEDSELFSKYTEEEINDLYTKYEYLYRNGIDLTMMRKDLYLFIDNEVVPQIYYMKNFK